ncbi:siderophore-interacting protein [Pseudomonas hunanensis]|uniref:siderophore-interacting protein n=1 Tax=Pseudomonas hunanensis TaxID=1247546 RepID=UPI00381C8173
MGRMIFSTNQCSPVELRLLKALRALNWEGNWPAQAGFFLEEMGLSSSQVFVFAGLVAAIIEADPGFYLLGPTSPFVSPDELNLLAALGNASRKSSNRVEQLTSNRLPVVKSLIDSCGAALHSGQIRMKTRASLHNGRTLPSIASQVLPFQDDRTIRDVTVVSVHKPTPRVRRIILGGHSLRTFVTDLPAQWVEIFLPDGTAQPVGRAFTIYSFDTVNSQLTFDIALHGDGPMSDWALTAKPGDALQLAGPRGGFKGVTSRSWLLLVADETGLPAVAAIVRKLPADLEVHVFVETADESERQLLEIQPNVRVRWIYRNGTSSQEPETLSEVLRYSPLPATGGDAWIAAEASAIRRIRTQLLRDRGFELGRVQAAGYWKRGEQDHRDLAAG